MGKGIHLVGAAWLLTAAIMAPREATRAQAQAVTAGACNGSTVATPMAGHYTGAWHSEGDYHFYVFGTDLDLKIQIDGTLDLSVDAAGQVSGTATGSVNAPITHDGQQDVSSGYGTISGQIAGVVSPASSLLLLHQPVIDMHWGTFGGHAVERNITMPDYQFPVGSVDCISGGGTIAETGFPLMNIVEDGTPNVTQAPGVGTANGTWQVASDAAGTFRSLSQQMDAFIAQANAYLATPSAALTASGLQQAVVTPFQNLRSAIQQHPEVARCLLDRLAAWESTALPPLFQQIRSLAASTTLATLRQAFDLLQAARLLNLDCNVAEGDAGTTLGDSLRAALSAAIRGRSWPQTALLTRELLLLAGPVGQSATQGGLNGALHAALSGSANAGQTLELARVSFAFGDDVDAEAAYHRLVTRLHLNAAPAAKKRHGKRRPKAAKTLPQVLAAGITKVNAMATGGATPIFSWPAVAGATTYVVSVTSNRGPMIDWAWAGGATTVGYGDTTIDGIPGSGDERWPVPLGSSGATWTVLALNTAGQIVGARFRVPL